MVRLRSAHDPARVWALLLLLGVGAPAAPVRADQGPRFHRHLQRALKLYQAGRYAAAIPEFQAAYQEDPLPRLLFNLGQAHLKLGQPEEALRCYERYLQAEPELRGPERQRLDEAVRSARAALTGAAAPPSVPLASPTPPAPTSPAAPVTAQATAGPPVSRPAPTPAWVAPAPPPRAAAPAAVAGHPARPFYRRAWFWGALGGVVAAGVIAGATAAALQPTAPSFADLGKIYDVTPSR